MIVDIFIVALTATIAVQIFVAVLRAISGGEP